MVWGTLKGLSVWGTRTSSDEELGLRWKERLKGWESPEMGRGGFLKEGLFEEGFEG